MSHIVVVSCCGDTSEKTELDRRLDGGVCCTTEESTTEEGTTEDSTTLEDTTVVEICCEDTTIEVEIVITTWLIGEGSSCGGVGDGVS